MHSPHHGAHYSKEYLHDAPVYHHGTVDSQKAGSYPNAADAAKLWATGEVDNMNVAYKIWRENGTSQPDIEAFKERMIKQKFGL
jgi:hypothetical protein